MLNVQHKTLPQTLPIKFYVFEDLSRPTILLSYAASLRLGIVQFTVPNETPVNFPLWINTIAHNKTVTFSQNPEDRPQNSHNNRDSAPKSIIRAFTRPFINRYIQQNYCLPFQDHKSSTAPFLDHKMPINHVSQDHLTTESVKDIIALKMHSPNSFDTTGSMPGQYTIKVDTSIHPVQHARRKVPIEARDEIEKALQKWLTMELSSLLLSPMNGSHHLNIPGSLMVQSVLV